MGRITFAGRKNRRILVVVLVLAIFSAGSAIVYAAFGDLLVAFAPSIAGNGRAVAFDSSTGSLYYTLFPFTQIFVTDANNTPASFFDPGITFGALSWDAGRGVLWGGAYQLDQLGNVYQIAPDGTTAFQFNFVPPGGNCYGQVQGAIDGLAYDASDDSLWISDDAAFQLHHVGTDGTLIASFPVPNDPRSGNQGCNTGIAVDGDFLWLGITSGPDQPPYDVIQVAKSDPTTIVQSFAFGDADEPGVEGLAIDTVTVPGGIGLWTNEFSSGANMLKLWDISSGAGVLANGKHQPRVGPRPRN
jgi:hypothetical protein